MSIHKIKPIPELLKGSSDVLEYNANTTFKTKYGKYAIYFKFISKYAYRVVIRREGLCALLSFRVAK